MYTADARHPHPALAAKLAHLYTLRGGPTIDLTIRPAYYELLRRLGDPHRHLPPVIHVAGTNGKGSVIATMRAVLEAAGRSVHVYTSPHLIRFNERIVIAGREITDGALEDLLDEVTEATGDLPLTFFEITTALAFAAFARAPADIMLLETGLGGRLDCTNVVDKPLATVITSIGYDHTEFLGATLPAIAGEKAGIMKAGAPCIVAPQSDRAVNDIFIARAAALPCPVYIGGRDWNVAAADSGMTLTTGAGAPVLPSPSLTGRHQIDNTGTALAVLQLVMPQVFTPEAIAKGLSSVRWRARLERLNTPAANRLFPASQGWELWVDGGHNESAARMLAAQAAAWRKEDEKPLHLVLAMMKTKDPAAFLAPLMPYIASLTAAGLPDEPLARDPGDLCLPGIEAVDAPDLICALNRLRGEKPGRILIAGSLYLAGEALRRLG